MSNSYCEILFIVESSVTQQGYCPLAKGTILDKPPVVEIARRLGKTPAQVLIRWSLQSGVMTIPKSTKKARVMENMEVSKIHVNAYLKIHIITNFIKALDDTFNLSGADMNIMNQLHDGTKASWDPSCVP